MNNILYTSDEKFFNQLYVSIFSLCSSISCKVNIHIISKGFSIAQIAELEKMIEEMGHNAFFYKNPQLPKDIMVTGGRTEAAFYRICAQEILPNYIDDVLYLDSDTIIETDIADLFKFNIDNYYIAGVQDIIDIEELELLGMKFDDVYVNSGVIIINLKKWREENIENKLISFLIENSSLIKNNDQDAINYLCKGRILLLPLSYNVTTPFFEYSCKQIERMRRIKLFYDEEQRVTAINMPKIIHYSGSRFDRPWNNECDHIKRDKYFFWCKEAKKKVILSQNSASLYERIKRLLHKRLPKCILVEIKRLRHK